MTIASKSISLHGTRWNGVRRNAWIILAGITSDLLICFTWSWFRNSRETMIFNVCFWPVLIKLARFGLDRLGQSWRSPRYFIPISPNLPYPLTTLIVRTIVSQLLTNETWQSVWITYIGGGKVSNISIRNSAVHPKTSIL